MIDFHFFVCSCPALPTPFVEEAIFTPFYASSPFVQILIDNRDLGLFLGSLFSSIDLCVCSYANTILFWLQWPCNVDWYQVLCSLLPCSSFSKLPQLLGSFMVPYEFLQCLFYICEICHWYFNRYCIESISCFGFLEKNLVLPLCILLKYESI